MSDCWALLSLFCSAEFHSGFNPRPDPLGRALEAARRAVDLSAASQIAHYAMAVALFFRKEMVAFHHAAQRAVELNPMDSSTTAHMGILIAYAGDWRRGLALKAEDERVYGVGHRVILRKRYVLVIRSDNRTGKPTLVAVNSSEQTASGIHRQRRPVIAGRSAVRPAPCRRSLPPARREPAFATATWS